MNCRKCGVLLNEGVSFCSNCGEPVNETRVNGVPTNLNTYNRPINGNNQMNYGNNPANYVNNQVNYGNNPINYSNNQSKGSNTLAIRIITIIGSIMCIIGIFLPFVKATVFGFVMERSFNEMAPTDHIIFLVVAIIGLLGGIFEKYILSILTGGIYGVILYIDTHEYFQQLNENIGYGAIAGKGVGYYCMLAGLIVMIVFGVVGLVIKISSKHK